MAADVAATENERLAAVPESIAPDADTPCYGRGSTRFGLLVLLVWYVRLSTQWGQIR
jgi:hypothetical protein